MNTRQGGVSAGQESRGGGGCRGERGVALIATILLLIPVSLLGALFLDAGRLHVMRVQMQVAADAAVLAAASGFIDGDEKGDSVQVRAEYFVTMNPIHDTPAVLESLTLDAESGTVSLVLKHRTGSLLWAPAGIIIRMAATARVRLAQPGETGRPVPNGNAFGWWKQEKLSNPAAKDSAVVRLSG